MRLLVTRYANDLPDEPDHYWVTFDGNSWYELSPDPELFTLANLEEFRKRIQPSLNSESDLGRVEICQRAGHLSCTEMELMRYATKCVPYIVRK